MDSTLTPAHYHAFGHLISTYAKVEHGFKIIIAHITSGDPAIVAIMTEPYTATNLRNVARSIAKCYDLPCDGRARIIDLVGELKTFGALRNAISHSMWIEGKRPDSIKPLQMDIRSGRPIPRGVDDTERDWTVPELEAECVRLNALHKSQVKLLGDLGLTEAIAG